MNWEGIFLKYANIPTNSIHKRMNAHSYPSIPTCTYQLHIICYPKVKCHIIEESANPRIGFAPSSAFTFLLRH